MSSIMAQWLTGATRHVELNKALARCRRAEGTFRGAPPFPSIRHRTRQGILCLPAPRHRRSARRQGWAQGLRNRQCPKPQGRPVRLPHPPALLRPLPLLSANPQAPMPRRAGILDWTQPPVTAYARAPVPPVSRHFHAPLKPEHQIYRGAC